MRKMRHRVKSLTAMLLSACLVLSQGAVNVWADEAVPEGAAVEAAIEAAAAEEAADEEVVAEEAAAEEAAPEEAAVEEAIAEAGPGMASSSDAEKDTETADSSSAKDKATDSDAMYDEDGLLPDGTVDDDMTVEIEEELIEAPEKKTEVIAPELAENRWYEDFEHTRDYSARTITLKKYEGSEARVDIYGTAQYNGRTYTVKIAEPDYYDGLFSSNNYVEDIYFHDDIKLPKDCSQMFMYCYNLESVDLTYADLSDVTTMTEMFSDCRNLYDLTFGEQQTSKLTDTSYMFNLCENITSIDLSRLDTSNVTNMRYMFAFCMSLATLDLPVHFTDSARDLSNMFDCCYSLQDSFWDVYKGSFNLANATDISEMFKDCTGFTKFDMRDFNLSKVTNMDGLFSGCTGLEEVDMANVDLSSVTSADDMFYGCNSLISIYTPVNLQLFVALPYTMWDEWGYWYDDLPRDYNSTEHITDEDLYIRVTGITLNVTARTMAVGEEFKLAAWAQPVNATDREVFWDSSDPSVASVDENGWVTAKKNGTTWIRAYIRGGERCEYCVITVGGVPVTSVKINTTARTIEKGGTFQLKAWPQPTNASNKKVNWSSSNPDVADVDLDGLVYALKGGTAKITAKTEDHGHTASCTITVHSPVTGVNINVASGQKTIAAGKTFQLVAWPQPSDANDKAVTWTSSNTAVATVSSTGLVTAIKNGTANITVKTHDGGFTKTCKITVGVPVTSVKINTTAKTISKGATFQLAAWPQPTNASNKTVTWSSSNTAVATVSSSGLVKGVNGGSAKITVKTNDGGKTAACTFTVTVPVTGVKINAKERTVAVGNTFQLAAWPQPSNANNKGVTWSSSNTAVATVSSTGLVTAIKNGTAIITVDTNDGGFTETCVITVGVPVTSVKINTTAKTISKGATFQMAAWPQPTNASNKTVTWSSSNTSVAKVSSTGLVTGVNGGSANITVKTNDGGFTATCAFTVTVPVTGVKINVKERTVEAGKTFQLAAWPQPSNSTNKAVTWSSSNTAVATVSSTGLVKGIKNGTATITVKTTDGGYTETCVITVGIPVTSVKINTTARTINAGATFQLAAWPQPTNASNKAVTWSSSNPKVVKVSSKGLILAEKPGTATVTVKTVDGGKTATCTVTVK